MTSIGALPRFAKPPVAETVLGIHFRPVGKFTAAHQGMFWDKHLRQRFPNLQEQPPLAEIRELFGEQLHAGAMIQWQVGRQPTPRLWATSESGEHVLQLQTNALFTNWSKTAADTAYCPYVQRRQEFSQQLELFERFVQEEGMGPIVPTSWLVAYINHIEYEDVQNLGATVANTLSFWTNHSSDDWLPPPDKLALTFAFPMPGNVGRLSVSLAPVVRLSDKKSILRLELTARGQVKAEEGSEFKVLEGIDLGHEWVVRGFASLTRPEMHEVWERIS